MREREVEKILVDGIRKLGGRAFKWVSPGNDGVPDRIVVLPGYPAVFVELKTITGRLTSLQRVQLKRLKDMGQAVRVLHGEHEVKLFLEECKEKLRDGVYHREAGDCAQDRGVWTGRNREIHLRV